MCKIGIKSSNKRNVTEIPNRFIDEFMSGANGSYIKLYLFLLRCLGTGSDFAISTIADKLDYTENDIRRALKYWMNKGILEYTLSDNGSISSIYLTDLFEDAPVADTIQIVPQTKPQEKAVSFVPAKDSKEQMLAHVEGLLGRPLSREDIDLVKFIHDELGFGTDLMFFLYQYCQQKGKAVPRYIERVAINWSKKGIDSVAKAEVEVSGHQDSVRIVFQAFGLKRDPAKIENDYIKKWFETKSLPKELIEEACNRTMLSVKAPDFKYCDGILTNWCNKGVKTLADVAKLDKVFEEQKQSLEKDKKADIVSSGKRRQTNTNQFNSFSQRDYSADEMAAFEKKLMQQ